MCSSTSAILTGESSIINEGDLVEYEMGHDKQGRPAAVNIRVL
jgi:cold shock CspA family protein